MNPMNQSPQESSTALDLETPRRDAVRTMGVAGAALLGALGLASVTAPPARGKKGKAKKQGKKAKSGPAGPAGAAGPPGLQGPAGPGVGLANLAIDVQIGAVTTVNSSPNSFGTKTFNCPPGGVIVSANTDLRGDVTNLSFINTTSTGPGNLTVRFDRNGTSTVPAQFVTTVICLVPA